MFLVVVEPHAALCRYLEIAQQQHHQTLVLTSNPEACLAEEQEYNHSLKDSDFSHIDKLIKCDTAHSEAMLEALQPFKKQVAGIIAGDDSFLSVTAELGGALGFDYAQPEDATCQHLKTAMKQRLVEHNVRTPRFVVARALDEAVAAWKSFDRDCMVKMVDYLGSMNVYRVATRSELEVAWDTIISNKRGIVSPFRLAREVILEEFVGGREFSAEGYVRRGRIVILNFCEKVTESNFIVVGHFLPAQMSPTEEQQLRPIVEDCVRALGIHNSVFHVEVHMVEGVPYVIECTSRPPGQHMVELMQRCYGFDLIGISIDLATGKEVTESAREPRRYYSLLALYSKETGFLERIEGLEELHSRGGVLHVKLDVKKGDKVEALNTFYDKYGFVVLEELSERGVREKASWLRKHVRLVVRENADSPEFSGNVLSPSRLS